MKAFSRISAPLAAALAVAILVPAPARAAVLADFNHDGIADGVQVSPSSDQQLVVRVSGSAPQVLRLRGRLISIVAVDIDHDGELDLSALSEHRGLRIWLNKGGHGRFTALKKKHVARGLRFHTDTSLWITEHHEERPVAQIGRLDAGPAVRAVRRTVIVAPPARAFTLAPFSPRTNRGRTTLSAPRAPPSAS